MCDMLSLTEQCRVVPVRDDSDAFDSIASSETQIYTFRPEYPISQDVLEKLTDVWERLGAHGVATRRAFKDDPISTTALLMSNAIADGAVSLGDAETAIWALENDDLYGHTDSTVQ